MKTKRTFTVPVLVFVAAVGSLIATPVGVNLGTGSPPNMLGGYHMGSFKPDSRPIGDAITEVAPPPSSPVSGNLQFDLALIHYSTNDGSWATWSHGYNGDAYWLDVIGNDSGIDSVTLSLPVGTMAFDFFVEPGSFFGASPFAVTIKDAAGTEALLNQTIAGNAGAAGFGFFSDDAGIALSSILITGFESWPDGFAIGEFSINHVSGPSTPDHGVPISLFAAVLVGLAAAKRRLFP